MHVHTVTTESRHTWRGSGSAPGTPVPRGPGRMRWETLRPQGQSLWRACAQLPTGLSPSAGQQTGYEGQPSASFMLLRLLLASGSVIRTHTGFPLQETRGQVSARVAACYGTQKAQGSKPPTAHTAQPQHKAASGYNCPQGPGRGSRPLGGSLPAPGHRWSPARGDMGQQCGDTCGCCCLGEAGHCLLAGSL